MVGGVVSTTFSSTSKIPAGVLIPTVCSPTEREAVLVGWANEGFYSGSYKVNGTQLYVSNGTGIWRGLPLRLGHNSEITLITLKSR